MTLAELFVYDKLQAAGYAALTRGWPDFLAYRVVNGVTELYAVEVKGPGDRLSAHQKAVHKLLVSAGIRVETILVSKSEVDGMRNAYTPIEDPDLRSTRSRRSRCIPPGMRRGCEHKKRSYQRFCDSCWGKMKQIK